MSEAPPIGSVKKCECGGKARRIMSAPYLMPEFREYTLHNISDKPVHFGTKTAVDKFRRDEFIKTTNGTKLEGKNGKLEYADKYFKQDLVKKQKDRKEKQAKALNDAYVKAEFRSKKEGVK
jgi:hypothetical protein